MLAIAFCVASMSFLLSMLIVLTKRWHGRYSIDSTFGIQKFHTCPTPRVGGLGIYIALCLSLLFLDAELQSLLGNVLWAGLPAFAIGLLEDLTKRIGVKTRLFVTAGSGALAVLLTTYSIGRLGLGGWEVDLLAWGPLALVFTAFAVCGLSNAVNIIDGFNGLASGTVILMLCGLGFIAYSVGDFSLLYLALIGASAVLGFMVINFPLGKLFLGDGGAYFVGFYVAWLAVMLIARNPDVSPFAALLVLAYPVLETVFSIARRRHRRLNPGLPDRLHLHSLLKKRVSAKLFRTLPLVYKNSLVAPMAWLFASLPILIAVSFYTNTELCMAGLALSSLAYASIYARLVTFHWCSPIRYLVPSRLFSLKFSSR